MGKDTPLFVLIQHGPHSKSNQVDSSDNSGFNRKREPPRHDDLKPWISNNKGFKCLRHPNIGHDVGLEVRYAMAPKYEP
ncbi:hypothetical protein MRB53_014089 [Persea americana]|uniref:Uncharacterized protein n=1 Tax=Persea americana TaxID=3435 RepID=A0ACC2K9V3_PERAE|nr:hypothetical protein MRB53_014089 [Persea americana]